MIVCQQSMQPFHASSSQIYGRVLRCQIWMAKDPHPLRSAAMSNQFETCHCGKACRCQSSNTVCNHFMRAPSQISVEESCSPQKLIYRETPNSGQPPNKGQWSLFVRYASPLRGIRLKLIIMVKQVDVSLQTEYATISCKRQPDFCWRCMQPKKIDL